MADPIWLDTSTIGDITDGHTALEAEIKALDAPLLMVPKVREEVLNGNPFQPGLKMRTPAEIENARAVINRMNIQLDTMGSAAERDRLLQHEFKFKPNGKVAVRAIEESDAIVLSQIGASAAARSIRPTLITTDGRLARNADARAWGVDIRLPSTPPRVGGGGGGGGGGGLPPGTPTISLSRTTPGAGAANASAAIAIFMIVDGLSNYLNDKYQSGEVNNKIKLTMSQIGAHQRENPSDGALVAVTFTRTRPNDPTGVVKNTVMIHPGDVFESISVYYALTVEEALKDQRRPEVRPDLGSDSPYKLEWSVNSYWVQAPRPALETPVGTWIVKVSRWTWIYDFDARGGVRWTDPFNKQTGTGTWRIEKDRMIIAWQPPSTTKENWDFPLAPVGATGHCLMVGEGNFRLLANKDS